MNYWDDYSRGNYWSDYLGGDADEDGVGDNPYFIDRNNMDNHPLIRPRFLIIVSSPYGEVRGSGHYEANSTIVISVSQTAIYHGNGTRKAFLGWFEDNNLISGEQSFSIIVNKSRRIFAKWGTQYEVVVLSNIGTVNGSGWYTIGDRAIISATPTVIEKDFFNNYVFEKWKSDGEIVSTSSTHSFIVDKPVVLTACWKEELNFIRIILIILLVAITILFIILFTKKKPKISTHVTHNLTISNP